MFLVAFLFLKEKLRAVLGLGQYYLRDVFHAPRSHIYVAYLPERSIKPHEPAPAHQHPHLYSPGLVQSMHSERCTCYSI